MLRSAAAVILLILCLLWPCGAATDITGSVAGAVTETTLPNGLTVLLLESHDAPVACTYVFYKVGSRDETTGITGISHQIEHMMFKGTLREFPKPGYIDLLVGRHGGVNNAETTTDYTDYFLLLPADQLDLALKIEADRMTQAAMDPLQLAAEKRVVLSELEGDENQNSDYLYNSMRSAAFVFHPYHFPIIGSKWDVQHFTREQVYGYYKSHYCPNNAVLVVVGDFKTATILNRIRSLWKDVKSQPLQKRILDPEPKQLGERRVVIRRAGNTAYLDLGYHVQAGTSADMPALDVLSTILTSGRSSRLYQALVEKQIATSVNSGVNYGLDPELFELVVTEQSGAAEANVESALLGELELMKTHPINVHDLQKAKNQTHASFILGQDGVQAKANRLGYFQVVTGSWRNIDHYLSRVDAVTSEDIVRVCAKYLGRDNRTVAVFEPNGEQANPAADSGAAGHSARYRRNGRKSASMPLLVGVPKGIGTRLSDGPNDAVPSSVKLPNGLTLVVQQNRANPAVTISGFVRAGSVNDPVGKDGIAYLTAGLLTRGTVNKSSQEIADSLDFIGATISAAAHRERIGISGWTLKENFNEVIKTLADCLQHPAFAETELNKLRGETETQIRESDNDTAYRANQELYSLNYSSDPAFAHDTMGTFESIKSITIEDIRNYYSSAIRPENTTIVVVGDITASEAEAAIAEAFAQWRPAGAGFPVVAISSDTTADKSAPRLEEIVMADKSQNDVAMGFRGISRKAQDYEAAQLMNLILGGDEFVGRVGKRVRDTEGLAYYAYTAFTPALHSGLWEFRAGVNPSNVTKAVASAKDEIAKMAAHGVTQSELEWAKDNSIGTMKLSMETATGIASQLDEDAFFGLGLDYSHRYPAIIRSITKPTIDAAAARYLRVDKLVTVMAGPPVPGMQGSRK